MSKHTPGPWTLSAIPKTAKSMAYKIKRGKYSTELTHEADARLISIAPTLLEMLTSLHLLASLLIRNYDDGALSKAITATLAKAEGKLK